MNTLYNKFAPVIKIGLLLGGSYVVAQYIFYFGGRSIIMSSNFDNTIQLLTIMGLYFGLLYCKKIFPEARFGRLFLFGISIMFIAVSLKVLFSIFLYGILAPDLLIDYKKALIEQLMQFVETMKNFPVEEYKATTQYMLNSFTIPLMEGISLLINGIIFSIFIAALHNMFRR